MDRDTRLGERRQVYQHQTLEQFLSHLRSFADQLGFDQYLYSALPFFYANDPASHHPIMDTTFDPTWMNYYYQQRYDLNDVVLQHCLSDTSEPCVWERTFNLKALPNKSKNIILDANQVGLKCGVTFPTQSSTGAFGVMSLSFSGKDSEFDAFYANRREAAELFAHSFNEAILQHHTRHYGLPHIPSFTEIEKQGARIIRKLKARNVTQAVALAIKWGIVIVAEPELAN